MDAVDGAPVVREEPEDVEVLLVPGRYAPLPILSQFEPERRESTIFDKDLRKHIFFVCDVVADGKAFGLSAQDKDGHYACNLLRSHAA